MGSYRLYRNHQRLQCIVVHQSPHFFTNYFTFIEGLKKWVLSKCNINPPTMFQHHINIFNLFFSQANVVPEKLAVNLYRYITVI